MSKQAPAKLSKPLVLLDLTCAALTPQPPGLALLKQPVHDIFPRTRMKRRAIRIDDEERAILAEGENEGD